ncbi:hypothetical protein SAMN05421764_11047 [Donghicola eburneus]|uniref:Putative membrane protein n=1 Tax=Donghicola eburneus TaxID=393278 RepID=A0A1M4MZG6_9RHOB|nr:putative membrane protein [Donghicola eburneus]SFQ69193.1 hypothetical protein SAMN05421764_11047 [Donghicola eburneus]
MRTLVIFLIVFGAGIGIPILALFNCGGWNEGTMQVAYCVVDTPDLRFVAEVVYAVVLLSSFTLGLPIFVYLMILLALALLLRWLS